MNHVSVPVQIAAIIRRLVNVISTLSLTNQYILSRTQTETSPPRRPSGGQSLSRPQLGANLHAQPSGSWSWLLSGYNFGWSELLKPVNLTTASGSDASGRGDANPPGSDSVFQLDIKCPSPDQASCSAMTDPATTASEKSQYEPTTSHDRERNHSSPPPPYPEDGFQNQDTIHRLMSNPALLNPIRAPRYPIVLCHGLYGFDVRGPSAFPSLRLHYWSNVLSILKKKLGADVIVTTVPGTGSIASRAENLDRLLSERARGRGVNLMAHSMGGLDCRHLITHVKPTEYAPLSLTSVSTPHRGSPFMDWCAQYIGLGRRQQEAAIAILKRAEQNAQTLSESPSTTSNDKTEKRETSFTLSFSSLPSSFTTLLLSLLDSPAYANLTTSYLNDVFNPATPDDPRVKYFSVVSRADDMSIWHPLWLPKMVLDDAEKKAKEKLKASSGGKWYSPGVPPWEQDDKWGNDGLVTVQSARWGEFLGILEGCDHWEIRGARGMEFNVDFPSVPLGSIANRVGGDGWALGDWSRFIGAWKKQEKQSSGAFQLASAANQSTESVSPPLRETKEEREKIRQGGHDDPVVRASTDKLSAVFDWMIEQVPTPGGASLSKDSAKVNTKKPVKNELATKMDLERFYIALTRKLYDEGL